MELEVIVDAGAQVVDKPWGYELHWAVSERYVGKILHIKVGEALSLQYHQRKDETLYVLRGRILMERGLEGEELSARVMGPKSAVRIRPGTRHRMTALEETELLEVSTPELGDVVRLQDRYGRA